MSIGDVVGCACCSHLFLLYVTSSVQGSIASRILRTRNDEQGATASATTLRCFRYWQSFHLCPG